MNVRVGLLDPSLKSKNSGDGIILEAVTRELADLVPKGAEILHLPTQSALSRAQRRQAGTCSHFLVAGTNLLSSNMHRYRQWRLRPMDLRVYRQRVRLFGVGWWQDQKAPNAFTSWVLRQVLSPDGHAARDSMTVKQLWTAGIASVDTACPTMWRLGTHPEESSSRGDRVLVTLTDYNRNPDRDRKLLRVANELYSDVVLWPQGERDAAYMRNLSPAGYVLRPGLDVLNANLMGGRDYLGTRLHAGVRALQLGRRATIVEIDNRAREIARSTGLPTITRSLTESEVDLIAEPRQVKLTLPHRDIDQWRRSTREWLMG